MSLLSLFGQTSNDIYPVDTANAITNAILIGLPIFFALCLLIGYVLVSFLLARIFKKAGLAGWKAWVPVYSLWLTYELGDQKGWWAVLLVVLMFTPGSASLPHSTDVMFWPLLILLIASIAVSIAATVLLYMAMYKIGLKFGKEGYFVLWAIFLPIVWYTWLAFDKSTWMPARATTNNTPASTRSSEETDNNHTPAPRV